MMNGTFELNSDFFLRPKVKVDLPLSKKSHPRLQYQRLNAHINNAKSKSSQHHANIKTNYIFAKLKNSSIHRLWNMVLLRSIEIVCSQLVPGNVGRRARPIPFPSMATARTMRGETRLKI